MVDPDEIAARVVAAFTGDEYWIDTAAAIEDVAVALREYGDDRARQERTRCARAIQVLIDKDRVLGDLTAAILHTEAQNVLHAGLVGALPGGRG